MTKRAQRSVGTIIKIGLNAIANLSSIGSPSITQEEIDVTTLDSTGGYREFIAGFKDPGEVSISGFFEPTDAGQAALYDALESGALQDFEIVYPADLGASWSFQGVVTGYNVTTDVAEAVGFEATIRVSGKPTLNLSTSSGLSNLVLAGTGGTLAPTFSNTKYTYTFSGVSADSVTVTATAAGHELRLYIDGVFAENLESGQASSSIALVQDVAKKLTIIAQESGKAPKIYEVVVLKTS